MVMPAKNYFLHCTNCGWEVLERTEPCEPEWPPTKVPKEPQLAWPLQRCCPKCGNSDLEIRPANNLKGKVAALLKGL